MNSGIFILGGITFIIAFAFFKISAFIYLHQDIDKLQSQLNTYAPMHMVKDLSLDLEECVRRGETIALWSEIEKLKKHNSNFMAKEEITTRMGVLNAECKASIEDRPTRL